jgi:hypothetical protein
MDHSYRVVMFSSYEYTLTLYVSVLSFTFLFSIYIGIV